MDDRPRYMISVAADLVGMHPQTLRIYESKGLIRPKRTSGNRCSPRSVSFNSAMTSESSGTWLTTAGECVLTMTCRKALSGPTGSSASV